jgi:hypothetical protein
MFSRSLEISPKPESVCGQAGLALATAGQLDLARYYLEEARRISGGLKDSRAVEALFKIAVLGKDESLAKRSIEDAFGYAETPGDWNRWLSDLADFALNHGDVRSALMMLAGIVASDENNLPARLKLAHILVFHDMIEQAVPHCDGLLRILGLPRNQTLESLADLADLFLKISDELANLGEPNLAAIARDIQHRLLQPAQAPGRHIQ